MTDAFAKLVGRTSTSPNEDKEFLVADLPCTLGRAMMPGSTGGFLVVDQNDNLLSRQHAEIAWSLEGRTWGIKCLSKNGFIVDKKRYEKDELAPLKSGSAIRLGNSRLYFLLPIFASSSQKSVAKKLENDVGKKRKAETQADAGISNEDGLDGSDAQLESNGDKNNNFKKPAQSYTSMIKEALESGELEKDEEGTVLQTDITSYITNKFFGGEDNLQMKRGVYQSLNKNFLKGTIDPEMAKKRGLLRWRIRPPVKVWNYAKFEYDLL